MKTLLLIVDPQNDFITGSLAVPGAEMAILNLVHWYKQHKDELSETCITLDTHPENHCSFKDNGGEWPPHCVDSTTGWLVYEPLSNILENDSYWLKGESSDKDEYSIFSEGNRDGEVLSKVLKEGNVPIYIAGIAGDYCVLNTIKDLVKMGLKDHLIILSKCIASIDSGRALSEYIANNNIKYE